MARGGFPSFPDDDDDDDDVAVLFIKTNTFCMLKPRRHVVSHPIRTQCTRISAEHGKSVKELGTVHDTDRCYRSIV